MSVRVTFLSAIIKKSAIRKLYSGGEERFRADFPYAAEDRHLFLVASMSGGEFDEILESLNAAGLDPESSYALGEIHSGEIQPCPDIIFEKVSGGMFPRWDARLIREDPEVMASEGARLYQTILERGWTFDIPEITNQSSLVSSPQAEPEPSVSSSFQPDPEPEMKCARETFERQGMDLASRNR